MSYASASSSQGAGAEPEPPREEDRREAASRLASTQKLKQQVRVLLSLALLALPASALAHALLLPQARFALAQTHATLLLACSIARELAARQRQLDVLRGLALTLYALLFAGAATVCLQIAAEADAPLASHLLGLSCFGLLAISFAALPLSRRGLVAVALVVLLSMAAVVCGAPEKIRPLYLIGFAVAAVVARAIRSNAAQLPGSQRI